MAEIWAKRMLPGSFRGIPFKIKSHRLSGGRNAVSHEPVDRDSTSSEDTGIKTKNFSITCHVLGDNYFFLRDAIIDAMDDRSVGVLVHPYLGIKEVRPQSYEVSEDNEEGRIAYFTLTFIEAGNPSFPISKIDAATKFLTQVVSTVAVVQNAFQTVFKVAELPGFALEGAVSLVNQFVSDIKTSIKNVRLLPDKQALILKILDDVDQNATSLVQNPASLAAEIDNVLSNLSDVVPDINDSTTIDSISGRDEKIDIFNESINYSSDYETIPETTPTRIAERQNAKAFEDLVRSIGICRLSEVIVQKDFKSTEEAILIRDSVSETIDNQILTATDDVFQSLVDLNSQFVLAVPNPNDNLDEIKTIQVFVETPSIVLSYQLFNSIDNEEDIIKRNSISHPGFIIGQIEVVGA